MYTTDHTSRDSVMIFTEFPYKDITFKIFFVIYFKLNIRVKIMSFFCIMVTCKNRVKYKIMSTSRYAQSRKINNDNYLAGIYQ